MGRMIRAHPSEESCRSASWLALRPLSDAGEDDDSTTSVRGPLRKDPVELGAPIGQHVML